MIAAVSTETNPDGTITVTKMDLDGNVIEQATFPTPQLAMQAAFGCFMPEAETKRLGWNKEEGK